jgi:Lrp/AsnC family leucine-responsive transcriptional regulator
MDLLDKKIIKILKNNSKATLQKISDQINLSIAPIARRINQLEAKGIIKNYTVNIDENSLGYKFPAFIFISLERQQSKNFDKFEEKILSFPEVVECWLMTGTKDYLIRIAVNDVEEFENFLTKKLTVIEGVSSVESSIPLRRVKSDHARIY